MLKVVDAAVAKAYGGKKQDPLDGNLRRRKVDARIYGPDVWLPDETFDDPQAITWSRSRDR